MIERENNNHFKNLTRHNLTRVQGRESVQLTSLPAYQLTSLPAYQLTSLPAYQLTSLPA